MIAASYIRVSTVRQEEGISSETQEAWYRDAAEVEARRVPTNRGYTGVKFYGRKRLKKKGRHNRTVARRQAK